MTKQTRFSVFFFIVMIGVLSLIPSGRSANGVQLNLIAGQAQDTNEDTLYTEAQTIKASQNWIREFLNKFPETYSGYFLVGAILVIIAIGYIGIIFVRVLIESFFKRKIEQQVLARKIRKGTKSLLQRPGDTEMLKSLERHHQLYSTYKFLSRDPLGLFELREYFSLSPETIKILIREAAKYEPSQQTFREIMKIICGTI